MRQDQELTSNRYQSIYWSYQGSLLVSIDGPIPQGPIKCRISAQSLLAPASCTPPSPFTPVCTSPAPPSPSSPPQKIFIWRTPPMGSIHPFTNQLQTQYYSTPFTIIHASFCLVISARNFCSLFASLSNSRTGLVYDLLNWQKFNFRVPRRWSWRR